MARILVIDDDDQIRQMLRQMFERLGYEVMDAKDGKEGIGLHCERNADVIITDIFMSEKEGIETIKELKQQFPNVNIIAMSGGSMSGSIGRDAYLKAAKSLGAAKTFTKPIDRRELIDAVQNLLK
ncbi:MAG: response regulator [Desulfobacterales bacterium]|nr:response regulator [Desulfobacterales bacterium]MBF0396026.1 response regulator [Desulfobacterales bacterium]